MKSTSLPLLLAALCLAAPSFAEDTVSRATPSRHQLLKDCVRRHQAGDVNLSKSELNHLCQDELKDQKRTGAAPPPPVDVPHDP